MTTIEFCNKYTPCKGGREFALNHKTMSEVWNNCRRVDWLFWILEKHKPLEKTQAVTLAIAFAEMSLKYVPEGENRPRLAIDTAKAWLENPNEENRAADAAADAAAAAYSADAAGAAGAARAIQCDVMRWIITNPF